MTEGRLPEDGVHLHPLPTHCPSVASGTLLQVRASGHQTHFTGTCSLRCESSRVRFLECICSFKQYPINKSLSRALIIVKDGLGGPPGVTSDPQGFLQVHIWLLRSRDPKTWCRKKLSTKTGPRKELRTHRVKMH